MAKAPSKSWLPKRAGHTGRFVTSNEGKAHPSTTIKEGYSTKGASLSSSGAHFRSSVSGRIDLPNGQSITTVRKDVMDRALSRGDFKKK